jgi:hypothetical protein
MDEYGVTKAGKPKKKPGRKAIYTEPMPSVAIKLPRWQVQYLENGAGGRGRSARLRSILERLARVEGHILLPPDPGPGETDRRSYKVPERLLEAVGRYGRGRGYTVAIRRAILADMNGELPK